MDARMGDNINGPSLIRVPDWLPGAMGRYYLYFADHGGKYIRLAVADDLAGPWKMYEPGVLPLERSGFVGHLASPDVHVDHDAQQIRMYYHGVVPAEQRSAAGEIDDAFYTTQRTRVTLSSDGIHFEKQGEPFAGAYFRMWRYGGWYYGLSMPALLYRSRDGLTGWEYGGNLLSHLCGPQNKLFTDSGQMPRHGAVRVAGDTLQLFHSRFENEPEHIVMSTIDMKPDWQQWKLEGCASVVRPEHDWEGADCAKVKSQRGAVHERAWQLRDPAVFEEDGRVYVVYSLAGESGLGIVEVVE
jgi:hypothetical protein